MAELAIRAVAKLQGYARVRGAVRPGTASTDWAERPRGPTKREISTLNTLRRGVSDSVIVDVRKPREESPTSLFDAEEEIREALALFKSPARETIMRLIDKVPGGLEEVEIRSRLAEWSVSTISRTLSELSTRGILSSTGRRLQLTELGRRRLEVWDVVLGAIDDVLVK